MFLVSLLYERKCLGIDLLKINCWLKVPFYIWFLYVLNRWRLFCGTPDTTTRKEAIEIYAIVMGFCLCLILCCSFRIIFILIPYVNAITITAFYDEALLKIVFKHCYDELQCSWCWVLIALAGRIAWLILLKCAFSWHFKQKVYLVRYCVFCSPVRRYLQVFLSLYSANRENSKVCLQISFGYRSETGFLAWVRENTRR